MIRSGKDVMTLHDRRYFRQRELEEEAAAERATSDVARRRHRELADLYRQRSGAWFGLDIHGTDSAAAEDDRSVGRVIA